MLRYRQVRSGQVRSGNGGRDSVRHRPLAVLDVSLQLAGHGGHGGDGQDGHGRPVLRDQARAVSRLRQNHDLTAYEESRVT